MEPDYKLMIVRYEDLHNDTEDLLRRMLDFLEWRQIDEYAYLALRVSECVCVACVCVCVSLCHCLGTALIAR